MPFRLGFFQINGRHGEEAVRRAGNVGPRKKAYGKYRFLRMSLWLRSRSAMMPMEVQLWRIEDEGLYEASSETLDSERLLRKWIEQDVALVASELLVIGSEVTAARIPRIKRAGTERGSEETQIESQHGASTACVTGET